MSKNQKKGVRPIRTKRTGDYEKAARDLVKRGLASPEILGYRYEPKPQAEYEADKARRKKDYR